MSNLENQALEMMSGNEKESEQAAIKRLAALSPIDYDRARKQEAEKLGISVSTLGKAVNASKRTEIDDFGFPCIEPWEYPINPDELLNDISTTVHRFIVCNKETADAATLWASMTCLWMLYRLHRWQSLPRLRSDAAKRSY